jgi:hypothetical protein
MKNILHPAKLNLTPGKYPKKTYKIRFLVDKHPELFNTAAL